MTNTRKLDMFYHLLLVVPPVSLACYIAKFGVNVIHYDELFTVIDIRKTMNGTLTLSDLFAQHNEHRILFPRLVMLANALLTWYNTVAKMYYSWMSISLTLVILFQIYRSEPGNLSSRALLYFLPVAFMFFSFRQYESILWGFMLHYMMIFCSVAALWFPLEGKNNIRFGFGVLSGFVSSFSFATGLSVWPVGLVEMLVFQRTTIKLHRLVVRAIAGVLTVTLYFHEYVSPTGDPSSSALVTHPLTRGLYLLALIGAPPIESGREAAISLGLVVALIALVTLFHARKTCSAV